MTLRTRFMQIVDAIKSPSAQKGARLGAVMMIAASGAGCAAKGVVGVSDQVYVGVPGVAGFASSTPNPNLLKAEIASTALTNPAAGPSIERRLCNADDTNPAAAKIKGRDRWATASGAAPRLNCMPQ